MYQRRRIALVTFLFSVSLILVGCAPTIYENNKVVTTATAVDSVVVSNPALKTPESQTPQQVTKNFYNWYLAYIGEPGSETFRNPMVDKAYHGSPFLTDSFVTHIDELLASFQETGGGYDPFLCAQDIPTEMTPEVTFERNGMASVVVRSSFPNHMVTVDLQPAEDSWLISNITCAHDPAGVATAFYTWYLGYIGDINSENFRNPLADRAYRGQPLLSKTFVQQVDGMFDENGAIGHDPFLQAQDVPQDFSVDPGMVEGTAVVHLQFGSEYVKHLLITTDEMGRRITTVNEVNTNDS